MGEGAVAAGSGVDEDAVMGDSRVGDGAVTASSGASEDGVVGEFDVGDGAVTAGSGVGEDISGVANVQPADSNITSVSGIRIIDSFFIFDSPSLSSVWILPI